MKGLSQFSLVFCIGSVPADTKPWISVSEVKKSESVHLYILSAIVVSMYGEYDVLRVKGQVKDWANTLAFFTKEAFFEYATAK